MSAQASALPKCRHPGVGGGGISYRTTLPPFIRMRLESGAFRSLCAHLRDRSDAVQNMDLMTLSGFCRNCLAKWLVLEARELSDAMGSGEGLNDEKISLKRALDALGYDETAEEVYGCKYPEWKKRHALKASEEQMERYNASKSLHAVHNKDKLKVRVAQPTTEQAEVGTGTAATRPSPSPSPSPSPKASSLLSNVCCEDVDAAARPAPSSTSVSDVSAAVFTSPRPPTGGLSLRVGILTVSDRAAANQYVTGDLSGPAVAASLDALVKEMNARLEGDEVSILCTVVATAIVPDETEDIQRKLRQWSGKLDDGEHGARMCDLVFTTGGTGFSPRDVTPDATRGILDLESRGLMSWVSSECSAVQPLAPLSRGTSGMLGKTLIANLPGSPTGVTQVMQVLFPLLLHAVNDVQSS